MEAPGVAPHPTVAQLLPAGYECYLRLFHPFVPWGHEDDLRPAETRTTWRKLAADAGVAFTATKTWRTLAPVPAVIHPPPAGPPATTSGGFGRGGSCSCQAPSMEMSQDQAEREMDNLAWADRKAYVEELDQERPWESHVRSIDAISNLPTRDDPQLHPGLPSPTLAGVLGSEDLSDPEFHRVVAYWGWALLQGSAFENFVRVVCERHLGESCDHVPKQESDEGFCLCEKKARKTPLKNLVEHHLPVASEIEAKVQLAVKARNNIAHADIEWDMYRLEGWDVRSLFQPDSAQSPRGRASDNDSVQVLDIQFLKDAMEQMRGAMRLILENLE